MGDPTAVATAQRFLAEVRDIGGADLAACWLHGGSTFADHRTASADVDVCVVLARTRQEQGVRLRAAAAALNVDGLFVHADDMSSSARPAHAFNPARPLVGWAVYRSHWLAGQYVPLFGREPRGWVATPTWDDLLADLDREVEHFERHVLEGDADNPDEATVAHLNGCRVLHTMATRNPVLSKRAAGRWGLTTQPAQWRPALKAALRCYDALATNADIELLRHSTPLFVDHVRNQVPTVEPRASGPPRWT